MEPNQKNFDTSQNQINNAYQMDSSNSDIKSKPNKIEIHEPQKSKAEEEGKLENSSLSQNLENYKGWESSSSGLYLKKGKDKYEKKASKEENDNKLAKEKNVKKTGSENENNINNVSQFELPVVLDDMKDELTTLSDKLEIQNFTLNDHTQQLSKINGNLGNMNRTLNVHTQKLSNMNGILDVHTQKLSNMNGNLSDMNVTLNEHTEQLENINGHLGNMNGILTELKNYLNIQNINLCKIVRIIEKK